MQDDAVQRDPKLQAAMMTLVASKQKEAEASLHEDVQAIVEELVKYAPEQGKEWKGFPKDIEERVNRVVKFRMDGEDDDE